MGRVRRMGKAIVLCVGALLAASGAAAPAALADPPSIPDPGTWITDQPVNSIVHAGGHTYIAGQFSYVGPSTGAAVPLDPGTGTLQSGFAAVVGRESDLGVDAVVSDGAGGYFVGGTFDSVGGAPRASLAHILATGAVDPNFDPAFTGNGLQVSTLALSPDHHTLYVGGTFNIRASGGKLLNELVALNATNAQPLTSFEPQPDSDVQTIALSSDGATLYATGDFSNIGAGTPHAINGFAKLATANGTSDPAFNPNPSSTVTSLALSPDGTRLYAGGAFSTIGSQASQPALDNVASLDPTTGDADPNWHPNPDGEVRALAVSSDGQTIYLGGQFATVSPASTTTARDGLAAVSASDGTPTSFNPAPVSGSSTGAVYGLALSGSTLYVGGTFDHIAGQARKSAAAISTSTGQANAFNPHPDATPTQFVVSPARVYMSGAFASVNGVDRAGVAQLDSLGHATSWNPAVTNTSLPVQMSALAASPDGNAIYLSGEFDHVGSAARPGLAAVSATTAQPTGFGSATAAGNSPPRAMVVSPDGQTVYVAGDWGGSTLDGFHDLGALKASDGSAVGAWSSPYSITTGFGIAALALSSDGSKLYLGGDFNAGGHQRLAAVNAADGTIDATFVPPTPNGQVAALALAPDGKSLYVGGLFTTFVAVSGHSYLAQLDAATGAVRDWQPSPDAAVHAVAVSPDGNTVYAGGDFVHIGAQDFFAQPIRPHIAAIDAGNAFALPFRVDMRESSQALAATATGLYAGGQFSQIGDLLFGHYAQFTPPPANLTRPLITPRRRLLTCSTGTWSGDPASYAYAWTRDGLPIAGAHSNTYTVKSTDETHALVCIVTATNGGGSTSAQSGTVRPPDKTPPTVKGFKFTPQRFKVKARATHIQFKLSERAIASITIKCRAKSGKFLLTGTLRLNGIAGSNSFAFNGLIKNKALPVGSCRATLLAIDPAGNRSATRTATFTVLR